MKAQAVFLSKNYDYIRETTSIGLVSNSIGYGLILGFLLCYIGILVWSVKLIGWVPIEVIEQNLVDIVPPEVPAAILPSVPPPPNEVTNGPYWTMMGIGIPILIILAGLTLLSYQTLPEKFWYLSINGNEITPADAIEGVASSSIGISEYFPVWYWLEATATSTHNFQVYDYPGLL
jgi:hypothetical protein